MNIFKTILSLFKPKTMSNGNPNKGGKGKGKGQKADITHYFSLTATKNEDGSVFLKWSLDIPLPEGYVLKSFSINKHLATWDEVSEQSAKDTYLGSPFGIYYGDPGDVRTNPEWRWEILDTYKNQPGDPAIKYNAVGDAGLPNDVTSSIPVGSAVVTITF